MVILTRIAVLAVFLALVMVSGAKAEEYDYVEYTIQKGDTLWDISGIELTDNFQWPMVWKVNPHIDNPDRIYPGQVINIPVSFLIPAEGKLKRKPPPPPVEEPVAVEITPKKGKYLISREDMLESGYITKNVPYKGEVTGAVSKRTIFSQYDEIYIKSKSAVQRGDRFYVIRSKAEVKHPVSGDDLGYLVRVIGIVEVEEAGTEGLKSTIVEAFENINAGDVLDDYYEINLPFSTGEERRPQVEAVVIAARYMKEMSGPNELIFIDKGKNDGLREGDMLMTLVHGTDDRQNGVLQLVNVRDTTSLALIIKSTINIGRGDIVTGLQ